MVMARPCLWLHSDMIFTISGGLRALFLFFTFFSLCVSPSHPFSIRILLFVMFIAVFGLFSLSFSISSAWYFPHVTFFFVIEKKSRGYVLG